MKEQSQTASNEDKSVNEKEKHRAKPESRIPLQKGRVVRKRSEPAPVVATKRSTPVVLTQSSGVYTFPYRSSVLGRHTSHPAHIRKISLVMDKREF